MTNGLISSQHRIESPRSTVYCCQSQLMSPLITWCVSHLVVKGRDWEDVKPGLTCWCLISRDFPFYRTFKRGPEALQWDAEGLQSADLITLARHCGFQVDVYHAGTKASYNPVSMQNTLLIHGPEIIRFKWQFVSNDNDHIIRIKWHKMRRSRKVTYKIWRVVLLEWSSTVTTQQHAYQTSWTPFVSVINNDLKVLHQQQEMDSIIRRVIQ